MSAGEELAIADLKRVAAEVRADRSGLPGSPEFDLECAELGCYHAWQDDDDFWMHGPDAHRWSPQGE